MQNKTSCAKSVWSCFACWKQTQDLCVFLLYVQYTVAIFQYVTQCSTCTRGNMPYFIILKHLPSVKEVHVCIKVTSIEQLSIKPGSSVGRVSGYKSRVLLWANFFHNVFFALEPILGSRLSPYKWNKKWHLSEVIGPERECSFERKMAAVLVPITR